MVDLFAAARDVPDDAFDDARNRRIDVGGNPFRLFRQQLTAQYALARFHGGNSRRADVLRERNVRRSRGGADADRRARGARLVPFRVYSFAE